MSDPALRSTGKTLAHMQRLTREVNEANGWHEEPRSVGEDVALLHSEVSEMLEAYRDYGVLDVTDEATGKPEGFGSECADVLIRLLDTCERRGVDLEAEFNRKVAFNAQRGYRHGGKRL